jgi:PD-(D/E)XK endonuclease
MAEIAIANAAVQLGLVVSRPMVEGRRYDLIFDVDGMLLRVQCKWAPRIGEVVRINSRTSRRSGNGHVRGTYSSSEVDAIAAWCPELERCYLLPIEEIDGQSMVHLRLSRARNNQRTGVKLAAQYELGAIAQLGERVTGSHEVAGSSPASSTQPKAA